MNTVEKRMVSILRDLRENHGAYSVKAEFEAEGTRLEELLRLKEITLTAELGLTLKIGGCESVRDILEIQRVGVNYLVAPMIESAYALRKYLQAVDKFFPADERGNTEILCNIETKDGYESLDEILSVPEINSLNGVIVERVDLCLSYGRDEDKIDDEETNKAVEDMIRKIRGRGLAASIAGGVSANSLPFFQRLGNFMDRYETRKMCFKYDPEQINQSEKGILKALGFEVLWLKNKINYEEGIVNNDKKRIMMIEQRYWNAIESLI